MAHIEAERSKGHVIDSHELRDMEHGEVQYKDEPVSHDHPHHHLEMLHHHHHRRLPRGILPAGESNRTGIHPFRFLAICARSSSHVSASVNVLWPFVPAAIVVSNILNRETHPNNTIIFALNFLAMVPTANLIGFAGQELARKLPIVFGMRFDMSK